MSNRPLLQNGSIRKSDMQGNELVTPHQANVTLYYCFAVS